MQIDDSGHDELAGKVDPLRAGWGFQLRFCADPLDAPIDNHHRRIGLRGFAGAVDEGESFEHFRFSAQHCRCEAGGKN